MSDNNNDAVRHGIDDDSSDDARKGLELGALGGGAIGAATGAGGGPIGAAFGGLIGGSVGSLVSGAAVRTVDEVDDDDSLPPIGSTAPSSNDNDSVNPVSTDETSVIASTPDVHLDTKHSC